MRTRIRHGFTLVELLVVMSIIAMLAGLLLPAVNSVREVGRRTQCINNQRNLGLAIMQYNGAAGRLPGWCEPMIPHGGPVGATSISWVWPILPHIERADIFRLGTDPKNTTANGGVMNSYNQRPGNTGQWLVTYGGNPHIKLLVCPNDSTALNNGTQMSYVGNAGFRDGGTAANTNVAAGLGVGPGTTPSAANSDGPNSAVFFSRFVNNSAILTQSLDVISGGDGTANTLLLTENINAGPWCFNGTNMDRESGVSFCFANVDDNTATNKLRINAGLVGGSAGTIPGPNSFHPNGVVVAFADSHTQFITQDIAWWTWTCLMTPRGDGVTVPGGATDGSDFVFRGRVVTDKY